jgi:hypothetical protein
MWTKEEEEELKTLTELGLKDKEIHYLLNDKFNTNRTMENISTKRHMMPSKKLLVSLQQEKSIKYEDTQEMDAKILTTKISHLLIGITPAEYTWFDKFYHWIKTRQARKQMTKMDKEIVHLEKQKIRQEIMFLEEKLKTVGR